MYSNTDVPLFQKKITSQRNLKNTLTSSAPRSFEHCLPEAAKLIYALLGDSQTLLALLKAFGGHTLRIPGRWPPRGRKRNCQDHELCSVLSPEQMLKFVEHFAGTDVYIPKCTKYLCEVRNASIVQYFCKVTRQGTSSGDAVQALAKRHYLSDRRIWGILKMNFQE